MTAGLNIWDAAGNKVLDVTDRLSRILGAVTTQSGVAGSLTNPALTSGTPFAYVQQLEATGYVNGYNGPPTRRPPVTFSGNTMSWGTGVAARILYGVW